MVGDPAKRHAVSTTFTALDPKGTGLVVQYELQLKNGLECGGAYLKLLTASEELSLEGFKADTPYTIMFGPDKCGDTNKVHFILRHKSPKTGEWEEKHLVTPPVPNVVDKATHLYTAIVGNDNSVTILVDNEEKKTASLLSDTDFKPPVNPPKEIDDPEDSKPEDWVDDAKMDDPAASKPDDWDEDAPAQIEDPKASKPDAWVDDAPLQIPDPNAVAPDDWDEDEDGEWEAPLIANPECKVGCGEWKAPMVANPDFKGRWYAPRIDNPEYIGVWAPKQVSHLRIRPGQEITDRHVARQVLRTLCLLPAFVPPHPTTSHHVPPRPTTSHHIPTHPNTPQHTPTHPNTSQHIPSAPPPSQIANPNYFSDEQPHAMAPIGGIGIELWTMQVVIDPTMPTSRSTRNHHPTPVIPSSPQPIPSSTDTPSSVPLPDPAHPSGASPSIHPARSVRPRTSSPPPPTPPHPPHPHPPHHPHPCPPPTPSHRTASSLTTSSSAPTRPSLRPLLRALSRSVRQLSRLLRRWLNALSPRSQG